MKRNCSILMPFALMAGQGVAALEEAPEAVRPNVLFLLSDDHSAPFLGSYGVADLNTPNLDRLAAEGVRFAHAHTTAPQCVPSRASLMTGRNVLDVGMLRFSAPLDRSIITFPEIMRAAGYYTGVCGRSYHLDGSHARPAETDAAFAEFRMETFPDRMDYVQKGADDKVLGQVQEFLDQVPEGRPFFMWANYSDPHTPFTAHEYEPDPASLTLPEGIPDTPLSRQWLAGHYGLINRLDVRIGEVLAELKKRGLYDSTVIIFMGDNGSAVLRGKGTLYQLGTHVPLFVRYPALIQAGSVSDILVSGKDLAPTVLELVGLEVDPAMTGRSFVRALQGDPAENHEYLFAVRGSHASNLPGLSSAYDLSRAVFNKKHRLIYNPLHNLPYSPVDFRNEPVWADLVERAAAGNLEQRFLQTSIFTPTRPIFELFDLAADPHEFNNLARTGELAEVERQLKAALHRWMILNRDVVPLPIPPN